MEMYSAALMALVFTLLFRVLDKIFRRKNLQNPSKTLTITVLLSNFFSDIAATCLIAFMAFWSILEVINIFSSDLTSEHYATLINVFNILDEIFKIIGLAAVCSLSLMLLGTIATLFYLQLRGLPPEALSVISVCFMKPLNPIAVLSRLSVNVGRVSLALFFIGLTFAAAGPIASDIDKIAVGAERSKADDVAKNIGFRSSLEDEKENNPQVPNKELNLNCSDNLDCSHIATLEQYCESANKEGNCVNIITQLAARRIAVAFENAFFDGLSRVGPNTWPEITTQSLGDPFSSKSKERAVTSRIIISSITSDHAPQTDYVKPTSVTSNESEPAKVQHKSGNSLHKDIDIHGIREGVLRAVVENAKSVGPISNIGKQFMFEFREVVESLSPDEKRIILDKALQHSKPAEYLLEPGHQLIVLMAGQTLNLLAESSGLQDFISAEISKQTFETLIGKANLWVDRGVPTDYFKSRYDNFILQLPKLGTAYEIASAHAITDLIKNKNALNFGTRLRKFVQSKPVMTRLDRAALGFIRVVGNDTATTDLVERHLFGMAHTPEFISEVEKKVTHEILVERMKTDKKIDSSVAELLNTYDDIFPLTPKSRHKTTKGMLLDSLLGDNFDPMAGDIPAGGGPKLPPFTGPHILAKSFEKLHGHSKVGGVLIGRQSSPSPSLEELNIQSLDWSVSGDGTYINLSLVSGKAIKLGPYPQETIFLALAYAVDGRPTAVTIMNDSIFSAQKVMLHPVLVNTALGCRVIEVDRWLSNWLNQEDELKKEYDRLSSDASTLISILGLTHDILLNVADRETENLTTSRDNSDCTVTKTSPAKPEISWKYLLENIDNKNISPVAKNPIYPPKLIQLAGSCSNVTDISGFVLCVERQLSEAGQIKKDWLEMIETSLPDRATVYGVREKSFKLSNTFAFMQPNSSIFDFHLLYSLNVEQSFNGEPWEFPTLKSKLNALVQQRIKDPAVSDILYKVSEFVVLQRLFRLAFENGLGSEFPFQRLVDLANDVASQSNISTVMTSRWLTTMSSKKALIDKLSRARDKFCRDEILTNKIKNCMDSINGAEGDWWNKIEVKNTCDFDSSINDTAHECNRYPVSDECIKVKRMSELRRSIRLGFLRPQVIKSEGPFVNNLSCPALRI